MADLKSEKTENFDYSHDGQKEFLQTSTNPFMDKKPIEKAYQNAGMNTQNVPPIIPEFKFEPIVEEFETPNPASFSQSDNSEHSTFNPHMNDLANKDKRIASVNMAEQIIEGYDFMWARFLTPLGQFNQKKIEKHIVDGEISSRVMIPISDVEEVPIRKFIEGFNENVAKTMQVDEGFKERVREPLIRVLEKKGLGMTDEQTLGLEVLKDSGTKIAILFSIRNDIKEITESFMERTRMMAIQNMPTATNTSNVGLDETTNNQEDQKQEPDIVKVKPVNPSKKNSSVVRQHLHGKLPHSNPEILAAMEEEAKKMTTEKPKSKTQRNNKNLPTSK